jgi:hypothetical protein
LPGVAVDGCGVDASLSGDGLYYGRVAANSTHSGNRKVQICKYFQNANCKFGDRCSNSHQTLPLYKNDLKNMVLKSAAEIASEAHEISHQPDSTEKKKRKIGRAESLNIYPSKIKNQTKKGQGKNGTGFLCSNKFSILSMDSDDEDDTEEEDQEALGENYQGRATLTGNFSIYIQQYFFPNAGTDNFSIKGLMCNIT